MQAISTSLPFSIGPDDSDPEEEDHLMGSGPYDDDGPKPPPPPGDKHRQH